MGLSAAARSAAQSFDRTAAGYDRLGDLSENDGIRSWLVDVLPPAGGRALDLGCGAGRDAVLLAERFAHVDAIDLSRPMIEIARAKRSRPNVTYQQADLLAATGSGEYDLVLSVLTLHHVPDLRAALAQVKRLLAPGGRIVLVDPYPAQSALHPARRILQRLVPLRPRLRAMAVLRLRTDLARRGPATAWEIYRLRTRKEWLDHRVSDRFFSREELDQCCATLFPGCQLEPLGGAFIGLTWDSPLLRHPAESQYLAVRLRAGCPLNDPTGPASTAARRCVCQHESRDHRGATNGVGMRMFKRLTAVAAVAAVFLGGAAGVASASTTSARPQAPASVARVTGGATELATAPGIAAALIGHGIVPLAVLPGVSGVGTTKSGVAVAFAFPVTGGSVNLQQMTAAIDHRGGIDFIAPATGKSLVVSNFVIDLKQRVLTAIVNGNPKARVPLLSLSLAKAKVAAGKHAVRIIGIVARLTKTAAAALDATFGTSLFKPGMELGTASTLVRF